MKKICLFLLVFSQITFAQTFTKKDTLKGSDTAFRNFWDVKKYELTVEPNIQDQSVSGKNTIFFEITKDIENPTFQLDLQKPMNSKNFMGNFNYTQVKTEDDFIFIETQQSFKKGERFYMILEYFGNPRIAKHAPWDGGWVFTKDEQGNPWISVAQEGDGTSLWLPSKDIWNDEPDEGIEMKIITPKDLTGVGNGKLISQTVEKGKNAVSYTHLRRRRWR